MSNLSESAAAQSALTSTFGSLTSRVNWKAVKLKRVIPDGDKFTRAYKVMIGGVTIGAIGQIQKRDKIHRSRSWAWVRTGERFADTDYNAHSYTKEWALADLLADRAKPVS